MTSDDYLGLPSPWYFERIVEGYADWGLPRDALSASLVRPARSWPAAASPSSVPTAASACAA